MARHPAVLKANILEVVEVMKAKAGVKVSHRKKSAQNPAVTRTAGVAIGREESGQQIDPTVALRSEAAVMDLLSA